MAVSLHVVFYTEGRRGRTLFQSEVEERQGGIDIVQCQGLTQLKMCELCNILDEGGEGTMLTITETQKKFEKFCICENYKYLVGMRDVQVLVRRIRGEGVDCCGVERGACKGVHSHRLCLKPQGGRRVAAPLLHRK